MDVIETALSGVRILQPRKHGDHRGFFSETYNCRGLAAVGIDQEFVQDNHSQSVPRFTVRGLHFQRPPFAQDKLVRVTRGKVLDVVVDLRRASPTFGQSIAVELSAEAWNQLYVPIGFAHGFCTLVPETEVLYKVSNYYSPECDRGVLWNDPDLGISWPMLELEAVLSPRDRCHPRLKDLADLF